MIHTNESWDALSLFLSASTTQKYLYKKYKLYGYPDSESLSYQNCQTFMYYLEYAQLYYQQAQTSTLSIRPILQFYGFIQLLKACILTVDATYPSSSAELAHGVSTRKRKKQHYRFLDDEVKVQKNGLFSKMAEKMFSIKNVEGDKVTMMHLLSQIPEMTDELTYFHLPKSELLMHKNNREYTINSTFLDTLHMTAPRFENFLQSTFNISVTASEQNRVVILTFENNITNYNLIPLRFNIFNQSSYLIPLKNDGNGYYSELMIHYLLLYNLSMIARYETEWWIDLMKTTPNEDFPIIHKFIDVSQQKVPFLIANWLSNDFFTQKKTS